MAKQKAAPSKPPWYTGAVKPTKPGAPKKAGSTKPCKVCGKFPCKCNKNLKSKMTNLMMTGE